MCVVRVCGGLQKRSYAWFHLYLIFASASILAENYTNTPSKYLGHHKEKDIGNKKEM
jgi:hypothetical protein